MSVCPDLLEPTKPHRLGRADPISTTISGIHNMVSLAYIAIAR